MISRMISGPERRDLLRALRLYGSAVFLRGNPMVLSFAAFLVIGAQGIASLRAHLAHEPLALALKHASPFNLALCAMFLQNCLQQHAGDQIGASQAPAVPGLPLAEARAAAVMSSGGILLLAALFPVARLPYHDGLFFMLLNTAPAAMQWYSPPRRLPGKRKGVLALVGLALMLAQVLLLLTSDAALWMLTRPAALTVPADLALLAVLVCAVLTLPNRAQGGAQGIAAPEEMRPSRHQPAAGRPVPLYHLRQMLLAPASPVSAKTDIALSLLAIPAGACALGAVNGLLRHRPLAHSIAETAGSLTVLLVIGDNWLTQRRHWPVLLATGRFGTRLQFARAVFSAKLSRLVLITPLRVVSLIVPYALLRPLSPFRAVLDGAALVALAVGLSLCAALPFLFVRTPWPGAPWQSVIVAFTVLPVALIQLCSPFVAGPIASGAIGAGLLALGMLCYALVPRRLARADWPYETAQEQD